VGRASSNTAWCAGELHPNEVKYYKFTIPAKTAPGSKGNDRFYFGSYVPAAGEPGFTFYVSFFGMPSSTECERWGDGWGRRSGGDDHSHASPATGSASHSGVVPPHRVTAGGTTWVATFNLPERVVGKHAATAHTHEGFDYHMSNETLTFIASPHTDLPNKFEPFSPTLFKPRGSCIADFARDGEYRIAVWGEESQDKARRFSVGLGLAERDVFAPQNLITFDYILYEIQTWNGWNGFVLILPILLFGALVAPMILAAIRYRRPEHYGTSHGWATPYRAIVLVVSGMLLGHMVINIAILSWAMRGSDHQDTIVFALLIGILIPLVTGVCMLAVGLNVRAFFAQPGAGPSSVAGMCVRISTFGVGVLHLFLHCGYIVAPVLLILASLLPAAIADYGVEERIPGPRTHDGSKHAEPMKPPGDPLPQSLPFVGAPVMMPTYNANTLGTPVIYPGVPQAF
jgi:hypothetical protein